MKNISPLFITGNYRSGTTLVSRILNAHSKLAITYDSVHFFRFCYKRWDPIDDPENVRDLLKEVHQRIGKRWNMSFQLPEILEQITATGYTYANIYHQLMTGLMLRNNCAERWGEKTNVAWSQIPEFLRMFPSGKAIMLVRDPRDVLASFKKFTIEPGSRYLDAVFTCIHSMDTAREYIDKKMNRCFVLKFEELLASPENMVRRICSFLELPFEKEMLNTTLFEDKTGGRSWRPNTAFDDRMNGISTKSQGRWKNNLDETEILLCEFLVGKQMLEFGYELSNYSLTLEKWYKVLELLYKDELIKSRFMDWFISREGVEEYPSDPLKPENWQAEVKDQL